jgi:general secretion pathway protein K
MNMNCPGKEKMKDERGVAVVLALLVLGLVTAAVITTATRSSRDGTLAIIYENKMKSYFLAEGGITAAKIALKEDGGINGYDTLDEIWSRPSPPISLGEGQVVVTVVDEESKLNVNSLIMGNGISENMKMVALFDALLEKLDLDPSITASVLDWLDKDDTPRPQGGEGAYYSGKKLPYTVKNDRLDSLFELKLVKGLDDKAYRILSPYLTTVGSGRININTAPGTIIAIIARGEDPEYHALLSDSAVEEILRFREESPFEKVEDIKKVSTSLEELYRKSRVRDLITTASTTFTVHVVSQVEKGTTRIVSRLYRKGKDVSEIYRVAN